MKSASWLIVAGSLALGCSSATHTGSMLPGEVEETGGKADGRALPAIGTWVPAADEEESGAMYLSLLSDKTYRFENDTEQNSVERGKYKFTTAKGKHYIVLDSDSGERTRMSYELGERFLKLDFENYSLDFEQTGEAKCDAVADCSLQGIVVPACVGSFTCEESTCDYSCGVEHIGGLSQEFVDAVKTEFVARAAADEFEDVFELIGRDDLPEDAQIFFDNWGSQTNPSLAFKFQVNGNDVFGVAHKMTTAFDVALYTVTNQLILRGIQREGETEIQWTASGAAAN